MCIAFPMKVKELLPDRHGLVESGGAERRVSLRLLDQCGVGDYVLVHAGYAIEKLSEESAVENLRIMNELKDSLGL